MIAHLKMSHLCRTSFAWNMANFVTNEGKSETISCKCDTFRLKCSIVSIAFLD